MGVIDFSTTYSVRPARPSAQIAQDSHDDEQPHSVASANEFTVMFVGHGRRRTAETTLNTSGCRSTDHQWMILTLFCNY